jgi:hypothetical protein
LICDWWWTVDCASSREHYEESAELLANDQKIYRARSDALSKSRARQHVNRKPGTIRDFEGASASVTSYSTEPVQRNARIQVHSKVINPRKHHPSSTPNPGFLWSSEDYQAGTSMEQAEQIPIHAFHAPYAESRQRRPQYVGSKQNRQFGKNYRTDKVERYPQNAPLVPRASKQQQTSQDKEFSENQPPLELIPRPQQLHITTHRPRISQFSLSGQFKQGPSGQHETLERITYNLQQPQQSATLRSKEEPQFRPEPQTVSQNKEGSNDTRTYSHIRFFPPSETEGQLPAETGSFLNNRGNHVNGIQRAMDRQTIAQNRVQEVTSKSYVELNRSRTTVPEHLSQMKPFVLQVTDKGITGLSVSQSSLEATTEGHPFDDGDGIRGQQSEEQFKNRDLFHPEGNSTKIDVNDDILFTESPVKHSNRESSAFGDGFKDESGEIDLIEDLGLAKPPTDIQFKDEDWHGGYGNSEIQGYLQPSESPHLLDISRSTINLPTRKYTSSVTFADPSQGFSTRKTHRFLTYTTALTPMMSEPGPVQNMANSNQKLHGEEVIATTAKPNTITSDLLDGQSTYPPTELTRIDAISIKQSMESSQTGVPTSPTRTPTEISFVTEEPVAKKVEPIFVEIIHRGSSEPPVLKTYTVEELEKRRGTTWSPVSTDEDSLSSGNPNETPVRSQTLPRGDMSTTVTVPPSRRVRPRKKLIPLTPDPDITPTKLTTHIPPTTLHATLSRKVQPSEITMASSNLYDKNKTKSDNAPPYSSTLRPKSKSSYAEHTTPVSSVTLSRRVQPPFESLSGSSIPASASALGQDKQIGTSDREASTNFQALTNSRFLNIGSRKLPQVTNFAQDMRVSTEPSDAKLRISSKSTKNSAVHVEVRQQTSEPSPVITLRQRLLSRKQQTMAESVETTTPYINTFSEMGILITEPAADPDIPLSFASKLEPTSAPQYRTRDGLDIPASSGPSTLHSLAVYFATQGRNEGTTIHTLTGLDFKEQEGKGEQPTTESVPVTSPTVQYGSVTERNETDSSLEAPSFLTKSIRDSYSELFQNSSENESSEMQEQVRSIKMKAESDVKIETVSSKTVPSSHNEIRNELLDKLAEISEMELKTSSGTTIPSSHREVSHSDTEDLLQGTDSRDLRELAQIFSHALSAYLEDPEEFKKALTEIRPKDPSSGSTDDVKQLEVNHLHSTTMGSVSRSTSVPLTISSTEYFSVTQEDEEVLDFSDVSKVSTRNSETTTSVPSYSKYVATEKLKDLVFTAHVKPTAVVTSGNNGVTESTSESSLTAAVDEVDLKPPEEGLQNAHSTYYVSSNQQDPTDTFIVSSEVPEHPQAAEGLGEDYTLPPGTKQYRGPGYGSQVREVKFGPTAGGVNDASRPRYGGFQNNSRVTPKEAPIKYTGTSIPEVKYHTRSTEKPTSAIEDVETNSTKEVHAEIGNILNHFVPQELNNLAVGGIPKTSVENMQKEHVQPHNLRTHSKQAVLGSSATTVTPSRASQPRNALNHERTWSSVGNIVDALTINRELSESDIEGRTPTTSVQEIISPVSTTQNPASSTKSVFNIRHRLSSIHDTWTPTATVVDGEDPTATLPHIRGSFRSGRISMKSLSTQKSRHSQMGFETESSDSHEHSSENPNPREGVQPLGISDVTFYSEKIKPAPPPSASLIQESVSRKNKVEALISSSASSYLPENSGNENSEVSIKTSLRDTPLSNEPTSITQTYSSTRESKSTTTPPNTAMKNRLFPTQQSSRLIKNATLRGTSDMALSSRQSLPASFTETPFPSETTVASWEQEIQESEQDVHNVNLQPAERLMQEPISSYTPRSRGASPSRRAKNATITQPLRDGRINVGFFKEDHTVKPNTSMSALGFQVGRGSVTFLPDNSTLPRGIKISHKQKSLRMEFLPTELNNTSNFQQSAKKRDMIHSAESSNSTSSPTIPTFSKMFPSNKSLIFMPRRSLETDLNMGNLTTDQLQALENLKTVLFSANSTIDEDGSMYSSVNESSAHSLINSMKKAVTNSTVQRLVLLLVSSFVETTPEETRSQLINALLRMPLNHKLSEAQKDSVSALLKESMKFLPEESSERHDAITVSGCESHPSSVVETTSQHSVITQPVSESEHLTMTEVPATKFRTRGKKKPQAATSQAHPIATAHSKGRRLVRVRVTTDSPQTMPSPSSLEEISQPEEIASLQPSDTRAVELLRSLYSLASRWG